MGEAKRKALARQNVTVARDSGRMTSICHETTEGRLKPFTIAAATPKVGSGQLPARGQHAWPSLPALRSTHGLEMGEWHGAAGV